MRPLRGMLCVVVTSLIACNDAGPGGQAEANSQAGASAADAGTGAAGAAGHAPTRRGDLTDFYTLHVEVVSDTCSPARVVQDGEVLVGGDTGTDKLNVHAPATTDLDRPAADVGLPLEAHEQDELVATCPDVRLLLDTGPVDVSQHHRIVVPWTESWQHGTGCSQRQRHSDAWQVPSTDCVTQMVLTFDWSRACPTAPGHFPDPPIVGAVVYCD